MVIRLLPSSLGIAMIGLPFLFPIFAIVTSEQAAVLDNVQNSGNLDLANY